MYSNKDGNCHQVTAYVKEGRAREQRKMLLTEMVL